MLMFVLTEKHAQKLQLTNMNQRKKMLFFLIDNVIYISSILFVVIFFCLQSKFVVFFELYCSGFFFFCNHIFASDKMDASSKGGSASCNVIKSAEDEDYLSNLCSDPDNDKVQRHVDHVNVESCQTPSKIPKQTDNFESSLEEHVFNQNMLSTSSPKPSPRAYLGEKTSSISSFKDKEPNNEDEHSMNNAQETLENQSKEAEEIVKKLCKNGKIMQFHEGDDYIKVIVYEDSQESNDLEDTLSVEELENTAEGNDGKDTEPRQTKNLLQCLTENSATNR